MFAHLAVRCDIPVQRAQTPERAYMDIMDILKKVTRANL